MKSLGYLTSAILFASLLFGCSGGDSSSGLDQSRTEITEDSEALTVAEPSTGIIDEDEELFVDESDLVEQTASSFKVTKPNGGQKWTTGKSYAIKWTKVKAGATVKIQLLKSGKHYKWISKKTKNDGKHTWKIPSTVVTNSAYKIKITSIKNKKIFDTSNKTFKITKSKGGDDSSVSYTISKDGSTVRCPTADSRSDYGDLGLIICQWSCGTYKGRTGVVTLGFTYESPSYYLSSSSVNAVYGCK